MWRCFCGHCNNDTFSFCTHCGKKKPNFDSLNNFFVWGLALWPIIVLVSSLIDFCFSFDIPDFVYTVLGLGITISFIIADSSQLYERGCKLTRWKFLGILFFPVIYLFARAAKSDKNFAPAIVRLATSLATLLFLAVLPTIENHSTINTIPLPDPTQSTTTFYYGEQEYLTTTPTASTMPTSTENRAEITLEDKKSTTIPVHTTVTTTATTTTEVTQQTEVVLSGKANYYEIGKSYYSASQYLDAIPYFQKAENYSDAETLLLDCYYQYGKSQMDLHYTSEGTSYLSLCRGYKDTDEILLSFYYSEASSAYNTLLQDFNDDTFQKAKEKLSLCEGYKDSSDKLRVIEHIYYAYSNVSKLSSFQASLHGMSVNITGNEVSIINDRFISTSGTGLSLTTNVSKKDFTATITRHFNNNFRDVTATNIVTALVLLFTDIDKTEDLIAQLEEETNWTPTETGEIFITSYGGYTITIEATESDRYFVDCIISVSK